MQPWLLIGLFCVLAGAGRAGRSAAVLINNSKYYYNYRMVSNVMALASSLKKLGFADADLLLCSHQTSFNYPANTPPNTQRNIDDDLRHNLLTPATQIDVSNEDVSLQRHLLAFNGRHEEDDPLSFRPLRSPVDALFLYLTGHGGDKYMKIQYLQILFSRHFSDFFEELFASRKARRALVVSDTCSAGTLFYTTADRVRAFLLGTSAWDDYSVSDGFDKAVGQPVRDKFSSRFHKMVDRVWRTGQRVDLDEFVRHFDKAAIDSTLLFYNHLKVPRKNAFLNDFLIPQKVYKETFGFGETAGEMRGLFFGSGL